MELMTPATIRLPERLDAGSVARLADDFAAAVSSGAPVLTLTGATAEIFCLGLALDGAREGAPETGAFADFLLALHRAPRPTLAVIDGQAIGGGLGIGACCDWVIASDRSRFALPELLWGLVPAIIWPVVSDRMAPHEARRWTISAHTRSAADALAAGLIDDMVDPAALGRASSRAIRMLSRLEPTALVRFREWAQASRREALPDALAHGASITAELICMPPARTRWSAFLAGETPWA